MFVPLGPALNRNDVGWDRARSPTLGFSFVSALGTLSTEVLDDGTAVNEFSGLHDCPDAPGIPNVRRGIRVENDQICPFPDRHCSNLLLGAEDCGGAACCSVDCCQRR